MGDDVKEKQTGAASGVAVPLVLALVIGISAGLGYGLTLGAPPSSGAGDEASDGATTEKGDKSTTSADARLRGRAATDHLKEHVVPLEPVIANIGGNSGRWIRLEGSVAFTQPLKNGREELLAQLSEDVMSYLRSTNLSQIESPAGMEFLKDDLMEIVRLRTNGRARRFILRTLVVE